MGISWARALRIHSAERAEWTVPAVGMPGVRKTDGKQDVLIGKGGASGQHELEGVKNYQSQPICSSLPWLMANDDSVRPACALFYPTHQRSGSGYIDQRLPGPCPRSATGPQCVPALHSRPLGFSDSRINVALAGLCMHARPGL